MELKEYYDVLGLQRDAGFQEIKLAYRTMSKKYHPDLNQDDITSQEKFMEIQEAYRKLSYRYKKIKNANNLQYEFYYTDLTKTGKILPQSKLLGNSVNQTFIQPAPAKPHVLIWIMLAVIGLLMIVYYNMTSYTEVKYRSSEFINFRFPSPPDKTIASNNTVGTLDSNSKIVATVSKEPDSTNETKPETDLTKKLFPKSTGNPLANKGSLKEKYKSPKDYLSIKSHQQLISVFGANAVTKSTRFSVNGFMDKCSILSLENGKKVVFVWEDSIQYKRLKTIEFYSDDKAKPVKVKNAGTPAKQESSPGIKLSASVYPGIKNLHIALQTLLV